MKSEEYPPLLSTLGVFFVLLGWIPCFSQETLESWLKQLQIEQQNKNSVQLKRLWAQLPVLSVSENSRVFLLESLIQAMNNCPPPTFEEVDFYFQTVASLYPAEPVWEYLWAIECYRWKMIFKGNPHLIQGNDIRETSFFEPQRVKTYQHLALIHLAKLNIDREEWAIAELRLQNILAQDPSHKEAQDILTQIPLKQAQKRNQLLQEFEKLVAARQLSSAVLLIRQLTAYSLTEEELKRLFPVCVYSIEVFSKDQNLKDLDTWFTLIQKIYPYEPILEYLWVNMLCGAGRYLEAQFHMIRGNDFRDYCLLSEEEFRRYQSLALTSLAAYNLEYAEWELAYARIQASLQFDVKNARAYILLGQMAGVHKNWNAVLMYFLKAHELNPKMLFAPHYMMLGKALITQKQFQKAFQIVQEGISRFPQFADLYIMQAELWIVFGKQIDAYLSYHLAYLFTEARSEVLNIRTQILVNAGNHSRLSPQLEESRFVLAFEQAVSQLLLNPKESLTQLKICTTLYPKSHPVLELLEAMAIEQSGDIEQAMTLFKKQTEQYPYFLPSYLRLFKCYWKQKKWNTMLIWLNRALELGEINNLWIAQIYFRSIEEENHYRVKFYKVHEGHPLKRALFQARFWNLDELLTQLEDSDLTIREQALFKIQELFKTRFGYQSQSSLEDMNKNIQSWKAWIPTVRPYLVYIHEYDALLLDREAAQQKVPAEVWRQLPEEKKQAWAQSPTTEKRAWMDELQKILQNSRPFLPKTLLPVYLVPNID